MKLTKECCHCNRRIWFWQKSRSWYMIHGKHVWRHSICRVIYEDGYALGKERGRKQRSNAKDPMTVTEAVTKHVKPVTDAMRKVGLI
jgi:hypothetical protein